jgi:hypothetical protein
LCRQLEIGPGDEESDLLLRHPVLPAKAVERAPGHRQHQARRLVALPLPGEGVGHDTAAQAVLLTIVVEQLPQRHIHVEDQADSSLARSSFERGRNELEEGHHLGPGGQVSVREPEPLQEVGRVLVAAGFLAEPQAAEIPPDPPSAPAEAAGLRSSAPSMRPEPFRPSRGSTIYPGPWVAGVADERQKPPGPGLLSLRPRADGFVEFHERS